MGTSLTRGPSRQGRERTVPRCPSETPLMIPPVGWNLARMIFLRRGTTSVARGRRMSETPLRFLPRRYCVAREQKLGKLVAPVFETPRTSGEKYLARLRRD